MIKKTISVIYRLSTVVMLVLLSFQPQGSVHAASPMDVTPITWNVIGLDSNDVTSGPNRFPVGARACNPVGSGATFTNVEANFVWENGGTTNDDTYIKIRPGSLDPIPLSVDLAPGDCYDFYFEVEVTRDANAYNETRRYRIDVNYNDGAAQTESTPTPRELFIEHLISQNRNATDNVYYGNVGDPIGSMENVGAGGTLTLAVGQTYDIVLDAHTATQGYNQLESFINFPNTIFQVQKIQTNYTANSSTFVLNTNDLLYADACLWDNVITSDTYLDCIGSDGKSGGTVTTRYTVKIISGVGTTQPLNTLLYDFSGSSFHYNSDFESAVRFAVIESPLSLSKSFNKDVITTNGEVSTMTLTISNSSASAVTGVNISDPLPTGMVVGSTPNASTTCTLGSGGSLTADASSDSVSLSNATIPASGSCAVLVDVTASPDGSYVNTAELFIGTETTGLTATDILGVNTSACTATTLVDWAVGTTDNPPSANIQGSNIDSANTVAAAGAGVTVAIDTSVGNPVNSWEADDFTTGATLNKANNEYLSFRIKSNSGFILKDLVFSFDMASEPGGGSNIKGPNSVEVYNSTDSYATKMGSTISPLASRAFGTYTRTLIGEQSDVTFRVYGYDPGNPGLSDYLF